MKDPLALSRRDFIKKTTLAAAVFTIVPRYVLGRGYLAPSDQLTKGIVGVGGMGRNQAYRKKARTRS